MPRKTASQVQRERTALAKGFREGGLFHCQCCPVRGQEPERWVHMHERLTRGRGGDPTDEFNIVLLCADCHAFIHANSTWATEHNFMAHA